MFKVLNNQWEIRAIVSDRRKTEANLVTILMRDRFAQEMGMKLLPISPCDLLDHRAASFTVVIIPKTGRRGKVTKYWEQKFKLGLRLKAWIAKGPDVIECAEVYDFADLSPGCEQAALNLN